MAVLKVEDVTFSYVKNEPIFQSVSLEVENHERLALQAASGCGKSTLCQLLSGYLEPTSGKVTLEGKPLRVGPGMASPVQLIWQHPEHSLDPLARIETSLAEAGEIPDGVIRGLGLKQEWFKRFPHELSGGELQRCCIARALSVKPQFIIADEISTMLDAVTQASIWRFLLDYCRNEEVGLVLVTHSRALQDRLATRVFRLDGVCESENLAIGCEWA